MSTRGPRYSKEEFASRGDVIYERDIRPKLRADDEDKYVAIDIETGEYEIDPDDYAATKRLIFRNPDSQVWVVRVGHPAVDYFRTPFELRGSEC
jgi:hypothetical protein